MFWDIDEEFWYVLCCICSNVSVCLHLRITFASTCAAWGLVRCAARCFGAFLENFVLRRRVCGVPGCGFVHCVVRCASWRGILYFEVCTFALRDGIYV